MGKSHARNPTQNPTQTDPNRPEPYKDSIPSLAHWPHGARVARDARVTSITIRNQAHATHYAHYARKQETERSRMNS